MRTIELTKGLVALVDESSYDSLNTQKWHAVLDHNTFYARRISARNSKGTRHSIYMHRQILGTPVGIKTDHKNGFGLDNRRENLRVCNTSQNGANRRISRNNVSGFKGVFFDKSRGKWRASIKVRGKGKTIGYFYSKEKAADAYNQASRFHFVEFAKPNA